MTRISKDELIKRTKIMLIAAAGCALLSLGLGSSYMGFMQAGVEHYGSIAAWPKEMVNEGEDLSFVFRGYIAEYDEAAGSRQAN